MRMWGPQRGGISLSRKIEVVTITTVAGKQAQVLLATYRVPYDCLHGLSVREYDLRYSHSTADTARPCSTQDGGAAAIRSRSCPLWVKSGHRNGSVECPLYPQKRTWVEVLSDVRFVPIADIYSYSIKIKLRGGAARRRGKSVVDPARLIKDIESHRSESPTLTAKAAVVSSGEPSTLVLIV